MRDDNAVKWVSIYHARQCYGGPEEGGWWYDWMDLDHTVRVVGRKAAQRVAEAMRAELAGVPDEDRSHLIPEGESPYRDTEGYIPTGFAISEGHRVLVEDRPGEWQTTERPRYE